MLCRVHRAFDDILCNNILLLSLSLVITNNVSVIILYSNNG